MMPRFTSKYNKGSKSRSRKRKKSNRRKKHGKGSSTMRKLYLKKGGWLKPSEHEPSGTCNFSRSTNTTQSNIQSKKPNHSYFKVVYDKN